MSIESIRLQNFKVFQNVELREIPRFCVLVGANGTGKTTLFDVFGFLKDCLTFSVERAIRYRGGFREMISRGHENERIVIEIQFRMPIAETSRLVSYHLELGLHEGNPLVERELLRYRRGESGTPFHFLDFRRGEGFAITNEEDFGKPDEALHREYLALGSADLLAIKGLGQFQRFRAASALRQLIENWHVSVLRLPLARGSKDSLGFDRDLSPTGDNLQLVAHYLLQHHPGVFQEIIQKMSCRVPGIGAVLPESTADGRLLLKFQDGSLRDPFIDNLVSDGTLRMFSYLVLLHAPHPHPLLCLEEPEHQIYPHLLAELAREFRDYSQRGGQVFLSTQSPVFLDAVSFDEVFWLIKEKGHATVRRARDDERIARRAAGGIPTGTLWKSGAFAGADPIAASECLPRSPLMPETSREREKEAR